VFFNTATQSFVPLLIEGCKVRDLAPESHSQSSSLSVLVHIVLTSPTMAPVSRRRAVPRRARAGPSQGPRDGNPPSIDVSPSIRRRLRFAGTISTTTSINVTRASLLSMLVSTPGYAAGSTSMLVTPLFESVRLRAVHVYLPSSAAAGYSDVTFEWLSYLGRNVRFTKTIMGSVGTTFVTHPPKDSRAAMWCSSNTSGSAATSIDEQLFTISRSSEHKTLAQNIPLLIDIEFDAVVSNDTVSSVTLTVTASTNLTNPGVFCLPLDFISSTGALANALTSPVGFPDALVDSGNALVIVTAVSRTN